MFGAIIGDIVGSTYEVEEVNYWIKNHSPRPYAERIKIMDKTTLLFKEESTPTDDTCWTLAILSAIINGDCDYETYLREYGEAEIKKALDEILTLFENTELKIASILSQASPSLASVPCRNSKSLCASEFLFESSIADFKSKAMCFD